MFSANLPLCQNFQWALATNWWLCQKFWCMFRANGWWKINKIVKQAKKVGKWEKIGEKVNKMWLFKIKKLPTYLKRSAKYFGSQKISAHHLGRASRVVDGWKFSILILAQMPLYRNLGAMVNTSVCQYIWHKDGFFQLGTDTKPFWTLNEKI